MLGEQPCYLLPWAITLCTTSSLTKGCSRKLQYQTYQNCIYNIYSDGPEKTATGERLKRALTTSDSRGELLAEPKSRGRMTNADFKLQVPDCARSRYHAPTKLKCLGLYLRWCTTLIIMKLLKWSIVLLLDWLMVCIARIIKKCSTAHKIL